MCICKQYLNYFLPLIIASRKLFFTCISMMCTDFNLILCFGCITTLVNLIQAVELDSFVVTPSGAASDGGSLSFTLNWLDSQYQCSFAPINLSPLICDRSNWNNYSITPDQYVPYGFKLEHTEKELAFTFSNITITDNNGNSYNINHFCIRLVYTHTHTSFM